MTGKHFVRRTVKVGLSAIVLALAPAMSESARAFHLEEASIAGIHRAILAHEITARGLVDLYLKRIAAFNGQCVKGTVDPATGFVLGDIEPIENAGQLGALMTVNLRGKRSRTDTLDNDPAIPDALDAAAALDEEFARTGRLKGPLHGVVFAVKDEFDTYDMRTTSGAAVAYANDRPPRDATVVARLRAAGAIILAKANMGEYAAGDRSTYGGTTCNPYDTTRSAGRSSGGSAAAVAANLVTCALAEETGPSTRNPAANGNLVGIVATHSLLSRAGIIPASLTRDRAGILCRSVKDAATVLSALAGYDPRDAATAASVSELPGKPYEANADGANLRGVRLGVVREFMKVHTKADAASVDVAEAALRDLERAGAVLVDPGPEGALFADALAEILPALDAPALNEQLAHTYLPGTDRIERGLAIVGKVEKLPAEAVFRVLVDREPPTTAEVQFALDRYLEERGDANIRRVSDLITNSIFYNHAPIGGVAPPPRTRLEGLLARTENLTRRRDGAPLLRTIVYPNVDIAGWHSARTVLQMLINKVMADHQLDALVYPTKTVPAPRLGEPVEPTNLETVPDKLGIVVDGMEYEQIFERVLDLRSPLAPRLSPNAGFPAIVVPAGFVGEVYDRLVLRGRDGSKGAGYLLPPKRIELPVGIDILGRAFSEPLLIRIAAAYEAATHHRRPPEDFGPLSGEP